MEKAAVAAGAVAAATATEMPAVAARAVAAAAAVSESGRARASQGSQGYINLAFSDSESAWHREVAGGRRREGCGRKVTGRVWQEGSMVGGGRKDDKGEV
tara:strand:+ start:656 stop:955 length:300 start_codon:yes stop_codon:yes gene_type:complete